GISLAVGLGNAIDVDAAAVLEHLAELPTTKAIALHLEGVEHGRRLYDTLKRVTRIKPVAALTVGKADVGAFARSHTGNLLGSYALRVNALRQAGAVVVETTEELAIAASVLSQYRLEPKLRPGIAIMTAQAGPGLLMLDRLRASGVAVPALEASTLEQVRQRLPPMTYLDNPVDTGRPGPSFAEVLELVAADPRIDAVAAYALHEPAALRPEEVLPPLARRIGKPLLFGTVGPRDETAPSITRLRSAGITVLESPEQLARAAIVLSLDAAAQARLIRESETALAPRVVPVPRGRDEHAAKCLLDLVGIPTPERAECSSHAEAYEALRRLRKPVVAKILSADIAHKTEVGGVHLNITEDRELAAALAKLDAIGLAGERRYLLEAMAPPGLELILGAVRDTSFGPTVMVGAGGTLAEALQDTATRLAPLTPLEANEMLDELRIARLLDGFRGAPALDRAAVARAITSLGDLLAAHPTLQEIEINPLRVSTNGVMALDALLR
ncbi:MAG TPA: acetate--CoA ligase family protein, partial [Polyangiaceae bacterium]|nr:acetate--CoA ligase family protein [Polyangiaceae bacterium]